MLFSAAKLIQQSASILAIMSTLGSACATAPANATGAAAPLPDFNSTAHHAKIVDNYLKLWKGDLSLLNETLSPNIQFNADRFPSSTGVGSDQKIITTREEFGDFVTSSADGFSMYGFEAHYWLGQGKYIAVRWYLDGVIGNFTKFPITLKSGDSLTYNGTDSLIINQETGLVDQIDSTQDLITFFHELGLTSITV
ncbi:hypothetical protein BX600DRAFT_503171 [Xylariales sp. PMI_506]|nr:hypothetical protein BX600DRAFT_503171 [Xylariales sp. PMI_506]